MKRAVTVTFLLCVAAPAAASDWIWIAAPKTEMHATASSTAPVTGSLAQGTRAAVRERSGAGMSAWVRIAVPGAKDGWIHGWDASEDRVAPAPAIEAPAAREHAAKSGHVEGPIDHRALDNEIAVAGDAAKAPGDDLVMLELVVDALYLDPATALPSAARRAKDAKDFSKGMR